MNIVDGMFSIHAQHNNTTPAMTSMHPEDNSPAATPGSIRHSPDQGPSRDALSREERKAAYFANADRILFEEGREPLFAEMIDGVPGGGKREAETLRPIWRAERGLPPYGWSRRNEWRTAFMAERNAFLAREGRPETPEEIFRRTGCGSPKYIQAFLGKELREQELKREKAVRKRPAAEALLRTARQARAAADEILAKEGADVGTERIRELAAEGVPLLPLLMILTDRLFLRLGRRPKIKELRAESDFGSYGMVGTALRDWSLACGIGRMPTIVATRQEFEPIASRFLQEHGYCPSARELIEIVGSGVYHQVHAFLAEWRAGLGIAKGAPAPTGISWHDPLPEPSLDFSRGAVERLKGESDDSRPPTPRTIIESLGPMPVRALALHLRELAAEGAIPAIDVEDPAVLAIFAGRFLVANRRIPTPSELTLEVGGGSEEAAAAGIAQWRREEGLDGEDVARGRLCNVLCNAHLERTGSAPSPALLATMADLETPMAARKFLLRWCKDRKLPSPPKYCPRRKRPESPTEEGATSDKTG